MDATAQPGRARAVPDPARPIPSDIQSARWARAFEAIGRRLAPTSPATTRRPTRWPTSRVCSAPSSARSAHSSPRLAATPPPTPCSTSSAAPSGKPPACAAWRAARLRRVEHLGIPAANRVEPRMPLVPLRDVGRRERRPEGEVARRVLDVGRLAQHVPPVVRPGRVRRKPRRARRRRASTEPARPDLPGRPRRGPGRPRWWRWRNGCPAPCPLRGPAKVIVGALVGLERTSMPASRAAVSSMWW